MKVVILAGKFGMGHYQAARAVLEQLEKEYGDVQVEVVDWMEYIFPQLSGMIYKTYAAIVNHCQWYYNHRYSRLENAEIDQRPEVALAGRRGVGRLLKEKKPDILIATLALCAKTVSSYKEKHRCQVPLITCVTDITGHSEWINKHTDAYMVGSEKVKYEFIRKGVPREKIFVTGIPVRLEFHEKLRTRNGYGYGCKKGKKLLLMGGGLGLLPHDLSFYEALDRMPGVETTLITGSNQALRKRLEGRFPHIQVLGFVQNISDYLRDSDLVVTKPGGITVFEAVSVATPVAALNPRLKQEVYNAVYLEENRLGEVIWGDAEECLDRLEALLSDSRKLAYYKMQMRRLQHRLDYHGISEVIDYVIREEMNRYAAKHRKLRGAVGFNI
ncbi:MGDG synthase family glycosyltransferase [Qiania dongpingensis]|uniref:Glycosyltransferase n=1 Tax=Qiania dongpingensis TaxID=2763669 RepID=A0A7G9G2K4_9FIRM|nr:glycosyltransferase [Qiania dongpingensis]QNM05036.1 glycosyltransferase [Qiania dongpingensis]